MLPDFRFPPTLGPYPAYCTPSVTRIARPRPDEGDSKFGLAPESAPDHPTLMRNRS